MTKNDNLSSPPRTRTSVAIQGLDISTPDDLVTDGKCLELHNLRWKDGAWRPVHPHREKVVIRGMLNGYEVVYKHPASDERYYIVEALVNNKYHYYNFDSSATPVEAGLSAIASFPTQQKVSHFGNVLMFSDGVDMSYYLYQNNQYGAVSANLPLPSIDISYGDYKAHDTSYVYWKVDKEIHLDVNTPILPNTYHPAWGDGGVNFFNRAISAIASGTQEVRITVVHMLYNVSQDIYPPDTEDGRIWGNVCLFTALRMDDGSILQVSPLHLISREMPYQVKRVFKGKLEGKDVTSNASFQTADEFIWAESNPIIVSPALNTNLTLDDYRINPIRYFTPTLRISIPDEIVNNPLVESVALYATRVTNVFDIDLFAAVRDNNVISDIYNEASIVDQPFYLVKEETVNNIKQSSNIWHIEITQPVIDQSIHNSIYSPSILTPLFGDTTADYNNRLHVGNITSVYGESPHFNGIFARDDSSSFQIASGIEIKTTARTIRLLGDYTPSLPSVYFKPPYNKIFSYPDINVKAFMTHWKDTDFASRLEAKVSLANGFAYLLQNGDNLYQYPEMFVASISPVPVDSFSSSPYRMEQPNRVQVSAPNNPFSFPFENSYSFGSSNNRILAMQSAAIEMHEMKVGEMPLYVFTEEGIYALVAGQNTLYASVAAINYDKIINPNTLAINGAIVYITEKGVHLLTSQGTQVISGPIHDANGMPPLDFLRECKIIWPKQYNEIVLQSNSDSTAYVYNLDSGYWSTRTLNGTKLNTDELYSGNAIYDLSDEDESTSIVCHLFTRPIKLGNVEFKRLESMIPRFSTGNQLAYVSMLLEGSVNGTDYHTLREIGTEEYGPHRVNPIILRRTPFSAKYFKLTMEMSPEASEPLTTSITHIDFEWYERFRHRMR